MNTKLVNNKTVKYSKNFDRDWDFYINNLNCFNFWGGDYIFELDYDQNSVTAKEYFYYLDSRGIVGKTCKEPKLVVDVLKLKKAINFHIKMWSEGYDDCLVGIDEYLKIFKNPPDWIKIALFNQIKLQFCKN